MARKNINYMMRYVKSFLDGKTERLSFELDFDFELMERWDEMCGEDAEYAQVINDWISEKGVIAGQDLSDDEFKELILVQYNEVKSIAADGFY